jgi:putative PIG3 family NAD(P)H quinone oxidoreductase
MTQMMKAVVVSTDDKKTMAWTDVERPRPAAGEVLMRVHATAVNRADLLQRIGKYPPPAGITNVMGLEAAGEIVELGEGVTDYAAGARVCCLLAGGGYAQYVNCPASQLFEIPDSMSFEQAAAMPEVLLTAYLNLYLEGQLQPGERALVHAGASGVGTAALQICRALGNDVYATASSGKLAGLKELGATATIDRESEDFVERVKQLTEGRGVDVILDVVGGSYLERNIRSLAPKGRLVVIGLLGGIEGTLALGLLLRKRLKVVGSVLRSRCVEEKSAICADARERVWPLVERGEIVPVIHSTLPIEQVSDAHGLLKQNSTVGKVILTVC